MVFHGCSLYLLSNARKLVILPTKSHNHLCWTLSPHVFKILGGRSLASGDTLPRPATVLSDMSAPLWFERSMKPWLRTIFLACFLFVCFVYYWERGPWSFENQTVCHHRSAQLLSSGAGDIPSLEAGGGSPAAALATAIISRQTTTAEEFTGS